MIKKIDITNPEFAREVLNIQIPSYKIEAKIIGFHDLPPLKDSVETLQQCGESFFGYYFKDELCGVISLKAENGILDIHRLIVHPKHFRKGIAKKLLDFIESNKKGCTTITVSTGTKNEPAIAFYLKNGFSITEEIEITEGLSLTSFKKDI
ncbi:GNAT family N-acetyltransferase [Oceanobacillus sp. J11TS1]|uniref:GNAT family N-acetyltransferase n=1 Tax=Oceanobacillus sp. J11TS1 TaxID=2807191 RepID=UPI001B1AAD54|nr:GNAT family N-acetyltransferase [Oceanobacillus sp. J11TS1]GIO23834.1 N-acetyltransferase [Oceanobacillus sp. J11TS1]